VVIGIIALLAAIVTPAVMRAQASARNAAIKAEIDMLHMAIMNYKNEYGSFPPCGDAANGGSGYINKHLQRLFPRAPLGNLATAPQIASITPQTALVPWLLGYTDDPTDPIANGTSSLARKKLYDFDQSRVSSYQYAPSGKPGSPYIYINSSHYLQFPYTGGSAGALRQTYAGDQTPFYNTGSETNGFINADTFQILCAGRDEQFGTDDDVSNFWPSTRKDYLDSLSQ
jgi:type II secretory pathway pseudopilin PulG